jgi:hypothetical protein
MAQFTPAYLIAFLGKPRVNRFQTPIDQPVDRDSSLIYRLVSSLSLTLHYPAFEADVHMYSSASTSQSASQSQSQPQSTYVPDIFPLVRRTPDAGDSSQSQSQSQSASQSQSQSQSQSASQSQSCVLFEALLYTFPSTLPSFLLPHYPLLAITPLSSSSSCYYVFLLRLLSLFPAYTPHSAFPFLSCILLPPLWL